MNLYNILKRLVENGYIESLQEKLDVFFAMDRVTREQYEELTEMIRSRM